MKIEKNTINFVKIMLLQSKNCNKKQDSKVEKQKKDAMPLSPKKVTFGELIN